jgi:tRNA-dependent cyclodipeptide synthase
MQYFHVTQEEINKKLFNIFVGISLGNKLLTPELAKKYVKWAHKYTRDDALILIADEIDIINWVVFRGFSHKEAKKKVRQKAYGITGMFEKAKRELYKENNDPSYITKVHIIFWEDIKNPEFLHFKEILTEQYNQNEKFKNKILYFVNKYIELRETKVSSKAKDQLADYIISELPTLIGGIFWNNTLYNLILYLTYVDSGMSQFVLDIRGGKYFDTSIIPLRQICVMVEDYLRKP